MIQRGILDQVTAIPAGTFLTADAAAGATVLLVDWTVEFDEFGGLLLLGDAVLPYVSADEDAATITLAEPLAVAATTGDEVLSLSAAGEQRNRITAHVKIDDGEEAVPHEVPSSLEGRLTEMTPEGTLVQVDTSTRIVVGADDVSAPMDGAVVWNPYVAQRAVLTSIPNNTWTTVTAWTDTVAQGIRVEADGSLTVLFPGFYVIDAAPTFATNSTGSRGARIMVNGMQVGYLNIPADPVGTTDVPAAARGVWSEGDNVRLDVIQSSGAALNLASTAGVSPRSMYRVST